MEFKPRVLHGKLGIKQLYSEISSEYDSSEKLFITRLMEYSEEPIVISFLENLKAKYSLDAGTGTGRYIKRLMKISDLTIALDISGKMISVAKSKHTGFTEKLEFIIADMEYLPFRESSFNIVLSTLAINHLENITTFLKEVRRTLKGNGFFIFSTLNRTILDAYSRKYGTPKNMVLFQTEHIAPTYIYEKGTMLNEVRIMLRSLGFRVLENRAVGYWVLLGLLPRVVEKLLKILMRVPGKAKLIIHLDFILGLFLHPKYAFIHVFKVLKRKCYL